MGQSDVTEFPSLGRVAAQGLPGGPRLTACARNVSWDELMLEAIDERAVPIIASAIRSGLLDVSPVQEDAIASAHEDLMRSCVLLERATLEVSEQLEDTGVEFRLLKGPAVAHLDYPDPSWRAFGDVDVLVRSSGYEDAVDALDRAGARRRSAEVRPGFDRRFGKGVCMTLPDGIQVDVHRTLASGPFGLTIDLDALFSGDDVVVLGGQAVPVLTREHRFLHACYHAALGDAIPRVVALRDIAQLLLTTDLDFDRACAVADGWRSGIVVAHAISATWERFGLERSGASLWADTYDSTRRERRWLAAYLGPHRSYARQMVAGVSAVPSWSAKLAYVRALLLVDPLYAKRHDGGYGRRVQRAWKSRTAREPVA